MINIQRILCPVDFSEFSRHALDYAVAIARWYDARLIALHVVPTIATFMPPAGEGLYPPIVFSPQDLEQFDKELASFAAASGDTPIETQVLQGNVVGHIVDAAAAIPADLLVLGTHGRSGFDRLMLGSVTEKLLRKAPCPVLTVPARAPDAAPIGTPFTRVLCAVDFSPVSLRALALAESLAAVAAAPLSLLHVLEPVSVFEPVAAGSGRLPVSADVHRAAQQRLETLVGSDTRAFTDVSEIVRAGKPYREILREASVQRTDLIVLGAHGGHIGLPAFGSTTNHVVREATCPVLTVGS